MRLLLVFAVCLAISLMGSKARFTSVRAAGPADLSFMLDYGLNGHHTAAPVDYLTWCGDCVGTDYRTGSPWVENPRDFWPYALPVQGAEFEPGCMWDSDDFYSYRSSGNIIQAGASASITECRYAAGFSDRGCCPQLVTDVRITSSSPNLLITEQWQWPSSTISRQISPVFDSAAHNWLYLGCFYSPSLVQGDQLVPIPNSNGGAAVPQLITVTVTNPTRRKIGKTGGLIGSGLQQGLWCGNKWVAA